jgi:seryl-tRNA synthetase
MIDMKLLREDPEKYKRGAAAKQMRVDIDALLDVDTKLRAAITERQDLVAEQNRIGKEIGALAGQLKKADGAAKDELQKKMAELQQRPTAIKARAVELDKIVAELEPKRDQLLLQIPQPADPDVPVGQSADDNVEIRRWNPSWFDPHKSFKENKGFEPKSHVELGLKLGIINFDRGVKIAGSRSYILTGAGMLLHQAILRYGFDYMVHENKFTGVNVPVLVKEPVMLGTGFFPQGREQAYEVRGTNLCGDPSATDRATADDAYLTGTGEVGLMGLHQDEVVDVEKLPLCYTTVSTCFRREAGAAGKDTAGLFRIHQFDKCEQVVICKADEAESRAWHKKMMGFVETLLQRLEIPYRLLQCCTADLGPKNADQVDIESWMPSRGAPGSDGRPTGAYAETHSASRLYDYQTRRLNIRYKDPATGKNVIAHSLNNTVCASPRILIPIMELYQNADGTITVPKVLRPYMGGIEKIG